MDPDGGVNIDAKLQCMKSTGKDVGPLATIPSDGWIADLSQLPTITHPMIYKHFMERSFRAVAGIADPGLDDSAMTAQRCIEKGFKMFADGHVQKFEFNPSPSTQGQCFVRCKVVASMKKMMHTVRMCLLDDGQIAFVASMKRMMHTVRMCLLDDGQIAFAICSCTAGLAGSTTLLV